MYDLEFCFYEVWAPPSPPPQNNVDEQTGPLGPKRIFGSQLCFWGRGRGAPPPPRSSQNNATARQNNDTLFGNKCVKKPPFCDTLFGNKCVKKRVPNWFFINIIQIGFAFYKYFYKYYSNGIQMGAQVFGKNSTQIRTYVRTYVRICARTCAYAPLFVAFRKNTKFCSDRQILFRPTNFVPTDKFCFDRQFLSVATNLGVCAKC